MNCQYIQREGENKPRGESARHRGQTSQGAKDVAAGNENKKFEQSSRDARKPIAFTVQWL